ncbi:MAG TPA: pitrilysin family protein, partial [Thermoanaerobaculia bacterium]|nr:pitrilysin family protein [Thermoanaerobaculia bacterium]
SRDAETIQAELAGLGAQLGTEGSKFGAAVALSSLKRTLGSALAILADVVQRPTFPPAELERMRKERLTELLQARDEPAAIASVALARALYGKDHRYGTITMGTEASVRRFSREDLSLFHGRAFRPNNAAVIVVGDVTAAAIQPQLEKAFGGWKAEGAFTSSVPAAPQVATRGIWIVDRPDSAQSEIRIGRIGPPRSTADYYPLLVTNTILGGSFTSRLMQNLREQHGYAYGARSSFDYRLSTGPFVASAAVQTDKTGPSLTEFFKELDAIGKTVTEAEVTKARNYVALSFPSDVETTRDLAAKLQEQFVYGLADGWLDQFVARVQAVTLADVRRTASQYIEPGKVAVVVVGDRKKIEAEVKALNLGPVELLSVDQVFGTAER